MLRYETPGRVGVSQARKILAEAASIQREWWRGALGLESGAADAPAPLTGSTPLFHGSAIPDEADLFMAFADAAFILERLMDWAKRFKLKWHLRMNDDDWGSIDPSGCSKTLLSQMDKWAGRAGIPRAGKGRWVVSEERRADVLARYAGRR